MSESTAPLIAEIADLRIALAAAVKEASDNAHELVLAKDALSADEDKVRFWHDAADERSAEIVRLMAALSAAEKEKENAQHSVEALTCRAEQAEERARIAEHQPQTDSGTVAEMGRQLRTTLDRAIAAENGIAQAVAEAWRILTGRIHEAEEQSRLARAEAARLRESLIRCGRHENTCLAIVRQDDGECDCPMRALSIPGPGAKMLAVVEAARASSDNSIMAGSTRLKCALADLDGGDHA